MSSCGCRASTSPVPRRSPSRPCAWTARRRSAGRVAAPARASLFAGPSTGPRPSRRRSAARARRGGPRARGGDRPRPRPAGEGAPLPGTPAERYLVEHRGFAARGPPRSATPRPTSSGNCRRDRACCCRDRPAGAVVAVQCLELDPRTGAKSARTDRPRLSGARSARAPSSSATPGEQLVGAGDRRGAGDHADAAPHRPCDAHACLGPLRFVEPRPHHRRVEILADNDGASRRARLAAATPSGGRRLRRDRPRTAWAPGGPQRLPPRHGPRRGRHGRRGCRADRGLLRRRAAAPSTSSSSAATSRSPSGCSSAWTSCSGPWWSPMAGSGASTAPTGCRWTTASSPGSSTRRTAPSTRTRTASRASCG